MQEEMQPEPTQPPPAVYTPKNSNPVAVCCLRPSYESQSNPKNANYGRGTSVQSLLQALHEVCIKVRHFTPIVKCERESGGTTRPDQRDEFMATVKYGKEGVLQFCGEEGGWKKGDREREM